MSKYRMVACSVDDFGPIPTAEIENLDEDAQEYFYIVESDDLDEVRKAAVDHCGEWFISSAETLIETLGEEGEDTEYWRKRALEILWQTPAALAEIAVMNPGDEIVGITSPGDWVRVEVCR